MEMEKRPLQLEARQWKLNHRDETILRARERLMRQSSVAKRRGIESKLSAPE